MLRVDSLSISYTDNDDLGVQDRQQFDNKLRSVAVFVVFDKLFTRMLSLFNIPS